MNPARRRFLASTTSAAALCASGVSLAQPAPVWTALGAAWLGRVSGAGGHVYVINGSEGVLMIDGGRTAQARALLATVQSNTGKRPSILINTHCHPDQTGCNAMLGAEGATIIAHENTRLWLATERISAWEHTTYAPLPASALPNKTYYYDSETLRYNGLTVEYGYLPQAHTDGDSYVFLPEQNLLFAGGVVAVGAYPLVDYSTNGWIGGMIDSLNRVLDLCDDNTRIFASEGNEVNRAHVQAQLQLCQHMADQLSTYYYKGGSFAEFAASAPTRDFDAQWGDPALFLQAAWEGVLPHVTEIRRYATRR